MNFLKLRRALFSAFAICSVSLSQVNAQTISVNGTACASTSGTSVTFTAGNIAINTAGCGGGGVVTPTISGAPPNGTKDVAYSTTFAVTGISSPTLTLTSGALPVGVAISGLGISGTPTTVGTYTFSLTATGNSTSGSGTASVASPSYTVNIAAPGSPTISGSVPTTATEGTAYSASFTVTGISSPTLTVASGALPPGVSISGLNLSGTPTTGSAATYTFTIKASNGSTSVTSSTYSIIVSAPSSGGGGSGVFSSADGTLPNPSKRFNVAGPIHGGAMGGGTSNGVNINAWSITPTSSCNTTPALTRLWGHKIDVFRDYAIQSGSEDFQFAPNEAVSYQFLADTYYGTNLKIQLSLTSGSYAGPAATFLSISKNPCDFDVAKARSGDPCYASTGASDLLLNMIVTSGSTSFCKLNANETYYINLRFQNATTTPADACTQAQCGIKLSLRYG